MDELLDLWARTIDPLTAMISQRIPEESAGQLVFDALAHEHDIRGAVGEPGSRTGDLAFQVAIGFLTTRGDQVIRATGYPAFRLTTPTIGSVELGDPSTAPGRPALAVPDFEALRAVGGRRIIRQLSALPSQGDPANLLAAFSNDAIRPPDDDVVE